MGSPLAPMTGMDGGIGRWPGNWGCPGIGWYPAVKILSRFESDNFNQRIIDLGCVINFVNDVTFTDKKYENTIIQMS
jgi:hypothetical protein